MTLTIDLPDNLGERLREEARRTGTDEAGFTRRALEARLGEETPLESLPEISLIERINAQGFDADFWRRYHELATLAREGILPEERREEFFAYNARLEEANVHRLVYLMELAKRQNRPVSEVMVQLGIRPLSTYKKQEAQISVCASPN